MRRSQPAVGCSMDRYLVFCHLMRSGYIVRRCCATQCLLCFSLTASPSRAQQLLFSVPSSHVAFRKASPPKLPSAASLRVRHPAVWIIPGKTLSPADVCCTNAWSYPTLFETAAPGEALPLRHLSLNRRPHAGQGLALQREPAVLSDADHSPSAPWAAAAFDMPSLRRLSPHPHFPADGDKADNQSSGATFGAPQASLAPSTSPNDAGGSSCRGVSAPAGRN